jgi:hypothetical protein
MEDGNHARKPQDQHAHVVRVGAYVRAALRRFMGSGDVRTSGPKASGNDWGERRQQWQT